MSTILEGIKKESVIISITLSQLNYASNKMKDTLIGPCTPTTRTNSISAVLEGPEIHTIFEGNAAASA